MHSLLASIPSPPRNALHVGPLQLHFYGLIIALGVVAAASLADRRFVALGGTQGDISRIALWAVPAGVMRVSFFRLLVTQTFPSGPVAIAPGLPPRSTGIS